MKYNFPKIDLHLHLDGALVPEVAYELAKERGLPFGREPFEKLRERMVLDGNLGSLYEYLKRFEVPIAILQDTEAVERSAYELVKLLGSQGVAYGEIRFAPQQHCRKGCGQREIAEAAVRGVRRAERENPNVRAGILLCAMTYQKVEENQKENMETVQVAGELLGSGVVGLDLAGAEGVVPLGDHESVFREARENGIPFTIHAGEVNIPEDVRTAIEFGASRIGHGQSCIDQADILSMVVERQVPLELCLTSNIQCHVRDSYESHPLKRLYDAGAVVTMNTDNMILSDITLDSEYDKAAQVFGLTEADFIQMNKNSLKAAFLEDSLKKEIGELFP